VCVCVRGGPIKKLKHSKVFRKLIKYMLKISASVSWLGCVYVCITLHFLMSKKNFLPLQKIKVMRDISESDYVNGLYVKDGRLINSRPSSMTGIQKAASIKREMKDSHKINLIVDAIDRSNR